MKKRFFAIIAAVAMTVTSVPAITLAADGGLYAELLQNGSFEMDDPLYSWETDGDDGQVIAETGKGGAVI
ncbi:MAG: hypothetical protein HFE51_02725 [Clostridia bacterium]|nr:hypothetical protein [Clostridia bacterium]